MTITRFQESVGQHARRLNISPDLARKRRQALVSLLEDKPLPPKTPKYLQHASDDDLLDALALTPEKSTPAQGEGGEAFIWLAPSHLPPAKNLLTRYHLRIGYTPKLRSFMVADLSSCLLPYGYTRRDDGAIIPDTDAAAMVRQAFAIIAQFARGKRAIDWNEVTRQINEQGNRRSLGRHWVMEDVKDLTRMTSYAGYVRFNAEGLGDAVEPLPEITEALIDLKTFVQAARVGPGKNHSWLRALESILAQFPESPNDP